MKTGILFDLDGTLLSTLEDLTDAVNYTLNYFGCPERTIEEVCTFVGYGAEQLLRSALPGAENDPPIDRVMAVYQPYYAAHSQDKTRPYDGILQALTELRKVYPVGIVSNKPDVSTKPLCKHYFGEDIYALGQHAGCPKKPAPDMLYRAMADMGVEKCIYVGDSEVDVQTAQNAGMPILSVLWGFRDRDCLARHGATHFCDDPNQLFACLKELIENGQ